MKKLLMVLPVVALMAGCQTQNQGALTGAALGAATGAAVSGDDDRVTGAIIGGAVGAAAGNFVGRNNNGNCVYQNSAGQRYTAACP